jgi:hypothetical protein
MRCQNFQAAAPFAAKTNPIPPLGGLVFGSGSSGEREHENRKRTNALLDRIDQSRGTKL